MADNENDAVDLWQKQPAEGFRMTPEEIQMKLEQLNRNVRKRTRGAYVVCAILIVVFSVWGIGEMGNTLFQAGAGAIVVAVAYLGYQVHQNRSRTAPDAALAADSIEYLRKELERQRDFHRGRTFWKRLLFLAGAGALMYIGFGLAHPEVIVSIYINAAVFVLFVIVAVPLNLSLARTYQRQIDELVSEGALSPKP